MANNEIDLLIITATKDEYDAVLRVEDGSVPADRWTEFQDDRGLGTATRDFLAADGGVLGVAVTQAFEMGGQATTYAAVSAILARRPRCLAMCGVCAGRRGIVSLGDVVFADRVWTYDTGKMVRERGQDGVERERFYGDMKTWNLDPRWKQAAERMVIPPSASWLAERPKPLEEQAIWILSELSSARSPQASPERALRCPNWRATLEYLRAKQWISATGLALTDSGRTALDEHQLMNPDGEAPQTAFQIHVGPIASGNSVREDTSVFDRLSASMRKVIGLEMEASAVGAIAELGRLDYFLVGKGVMDHADGEKNDHFKPFAARASAECVIAFARQNLSSRGSAARRGAGSAGGGTAETKMVSFERNPPIKLEDSYLVWAQERGTGEYVTFAVPADATAGARRVRISGLLHATTQRLWELRKERRPVCILPEDVLSRWLEDSREFSARDARKAIHLVDLALVEHETGLRMPLASTDPAPLAHCEYFEYDRCVTIRGSVGPYFLVTQSDWRYAGGAHPDTSCEFIVLDVDDCSRVDQWLSAEEREDIESHEGAVARALFVKLRNHEWMLDAADEGRVQSVDLVAAEPVIHDAGWIQLRLQFATFTSYVGSDGQWSSYSISEHVPSRDLPLLFRQYRGVPGPVLEMSRCLAKEDMRLGGWSVMGAKHPAWSRLILLAQYR
ncbi:hypothetical protein WME89_19735 [Sorangium sp. So ce321]|uniref:hypothetical protein n=1 Tax=Sorangium sp. So ce321 TaxID=3133300 RepID=UPI003F60FC58